jgi:hypothetical protein
MVELALDWRHQLRLETDAAPWPFDYILLDVYTVAAVDEVAPATFSSRSGIIVARLSHASETPAGPRMACRLRLL